MFFFFLNEKKKSGNRRKFVLDHMGSNMIIYLLDCNNLMLNVKRNCINLILRDCVNG